MSKFRKIIAEIQQNEEGSFNTSIYKDGALENKTYLIKDDVIERILENFTFEANHADTPEEGVGFTFEMTGTATLSGVESQYGQLTEEDKHYIQEELNDNQKAKDYIKDAAYDFTRDIEDMHIYVDFTVEGSAIKVKASVEL